MRALLVGVLSAVVVAACGSDHSTIVADERGPGAHDVVFRVEQRGGFVSPESTFGRTPSVAVYGDGTTLVPGAMIEIYPGPAYVPLQRGSITGREIERLVDLADELDLTGASVDAGQPPVADAPDTVVTVRTRAGRLVEHRANALGMDAGGSGALTSAQQDARRRLQRLVAELESAAGAVGSEEYVPDGYLLRARPAEPAAVPQPGEPKPRVKPWPVASVDLAAATDCLAVTGGPADDVRTTMRQADQLTFFTQGGQSYRVVVRPLLPDEDGCPAKG